VKKLIKTLKDNLLTIILFTIGLDILIEEVLDIQLPTLLVMIWSVLILTLCIWGIVDTIRFAMKNKKNKKIPKP
jgi:predicted tellurium resistance membrane protein TerC